MKYLAQQIDTFLTSNIQETVPLWSPTTTYTFESGTPTNASLARYGSYIYRSLVNSNLNFSPADYNNTKWIKWSASNAYSMLDMRSGTTTKNYQADIIVTFTYTFGMDTLVIGNYASLGFKVELLDDLGATIWTYDQPSQINEEVIDYWSYIYADYGFEVNRAVMIPLTPLAGTKTVRVTLYQAVGEFTECGFLVAGQAVDMGQTLNSVSLNFNSFATKEFDTFGTVNIVKRAIQDISDFETIIDSPSVPEFKRKIKLVYDDIIVFIVDDTTDSAYENLITLGTVQDASIILNNPSKSIISWSVVEVVA